MIISRLRRASLLSLSMSRNFSIKKNDPKPQWQTKKQIFKQIVPYVLPFKSQNKEVRNPLLKSYVYLALSRICLFGGPVFLKYAIDTMKSTGGTIDPLLLIFGYGVCYIGSVVFVSFRSIQITKVSYAAMKQVSLKLYIKLLSLPKTFFAGRPLGDTLFQFDRAQNGLSKLIKIMNQQLLPIGFDVIFGTVMLLYYFSIPFAMTFLSTFVVYAYFTFKYNDDKRNFDIKIQKNTQKKLNTVLSEAVRNYQNVKYYSAQKHQISKYHQILKLLEQKALITNKSLGILNSGQRAIFGTGLTVNLMLAAHYAKKGLVAVGDVVLIQTLMLQLFNPLNMLGMMYRVVTESFVDLKYFIKLMNEQPQIIQSPNAKQSPKLQGNIKFKNVSFHYPEKNYNILMNKSFQIQPNQFVGLMGASGSGKSTSLNLIFRTLDPTSGEIFIDNENVKNLKLQSFRNQICVISQTPYLFNDTILNNILYCNQISTKQDVIQICKKLDLHDYIESLPEGYDTYVGDQGSLFSGGEKQRISICRGLLQNKKIVLLDEPLSSLDKQNAQRVINLLKSYNNCTRIMVTHHQQFIQDMDRTIYLDKN